MLNIVVVEDHDALRQSMLDALSTQDQHVLAVDCAEALPELGCLSIDLMIIDLNLPGEDGLSLAKRIRNIHPNIGIIMLTARILAVDRALGYASGADIYLSKPTSLEELTAAVGSLARRIKQLRPAVEILQLDSEHLTLSGKLDSIRLTRHESTLLAAFVLAHEKKLEVWQMIQLLGKSELDYNKSALELLIVRLRKKLIAAGAQAKPIQAIRDYGYQLCETVHLR